MKWEQFENKHHVVAAKSLWDSEKKKKSAQWRFHQRVKGTKIIKERNVRGWGRGREGEK